MLVGYDDLKDQNEGFHDDDKSINHKFLLSESHDLLSQVVARFSTKCKAITGTLAFLDLVETLRSPPKLAWSTRF